VDPQLDKTNETPHELKPEPRASRRLSYHPRRTAREVLLDLAEAADPEVEQDHYGNGEVVERLELRVSEMLGKEAAVFMPSGTMAQQIALRIWCDRAGTNQVAFHPTSHLELHEENAYRRLHGMSATLLGDRDRLFSMKDLASMHEPVAAILFELPQREIGGQLPPWKDLVAMTSWARERDIVTHVDGARLWETKPFYGRSYADIAELFDSVYVSFYKILSGIAGAALAGPKHLIDTARVWQRRHGGNLVHLYPLALSAQLGMDRELDRMEEYRDKAVEIAAILSSLPGVTVSPDPPHTNMMHVFLEGDADRLLAAHRQLVEERDVELFASLGPSGVPSLSRFEFVVASATVAFDGEEIRDLFTWLLDHARN
jgi:threonine aldolase